jgi:effector-binding domain-containing protein
VHRGGYDSIDRTYEKVFRYLDERGWTARVPTREVYWKGPGMILRGNPDRYVTEVQVLYDVT